MPYRMKKAAALPMTWNHMMVLVRASSRIGLWTKMTVIIVKLVAERIVP